MALLDRWGVIELVCSSSLAPFMRGEVRAVPLIWVHSKQARGLGVLFNMVE